MKDLKSTLIRHSVMTSASTVVAVAFMALPALEPTRDTISLQLGLSGQLGLWAPVAAVVACVHALVYYLSVKTIARPFQKLATNATHCEQGFAFKTKSNSSEEDAIKHAIETNNLKTREAQQLAEELEGELHDLKTQLESAQAKIQDLSTSKQEAERLTSKLRVDCESLKASKTALELTLDNERRSKIGAEIEKRSDEIYTQMERAVSAAALKSIWLPSFVQELKGPAAVIKEITSALNGNCHHTPLSQITEQIDLIHQQNENQIAILEDILAKQTTDFSQERPVPADLELQEAPSDPVETPELTVNEGVEVEVIAPETEATTIAPQLERNPFALESILQNLVEEFSPLAPDSHITYSFDPDLGIEIEDESLLALLHSLVEAAVALVENGEITLGVDLTTSDLTFDVACDGELGLNLSPSLDTAKQHAERLGGTIEIERCSSNELHFSFAYPLDPAEAEAPTSADVIEIQSQTIDNE